jgi:hypothetical protein
VIEHDGYAGERLQTIDGLGIADHPMSACG